MGVALFLVDQFHPHDFAREHKGHEDCAAIGQARQAIAARDHFFHCECVDLCQGLSFSCVRAEK